MATPATRWYGYGMVFEDGSVKVAGTLARGAGVTLVPSHIDPAASSAAAAAAAASLQCHLPQYDATVPPTSHYLVQSLARVNDPSHPMPCHAMHIFQIICIRSCQSTISTRPNADKGGRSLTQL